LTNKTSQALVVVYSFARFEAEDNAGRKDFKRNQNSKKNTETQGCNSFTTEESLIIEQCEMCRRRWWQSKEMIVIVASKLEMNYFFNN